MKHLYSVWLICFCFALAFFSSQSAMAQFYNGTRTDFGKNRVQYDEFKWQYYKFNKFETYFYTGGKDLAKYTANYANVRIKEIEKFLDFYLDEPIQFIIYNKQSHFRQSNIGLSTNENYNIGGVSRIVGNKLFVYFEDDYDQFTQQLDAGIINVLVYQYIFGGNWREVLRNSALLHLPEWYINGLVSYLSNPDDPLVKAKIKDGILTDRFKRFNGLTNEDAKIAGHAMWQYVAEVYGENVISSVLYMTRISREIDDGFLYVIGVPFEDLYDDWIKYFKEKYDLKQNKISKNQGEEVEFKIKKNRRYQNFITGPNGKYIAYTTNKYGKYKVFLYDREESKRIKIFVNEHKLDRIQDYSYPLLAWHPSGELVSFIIEDKGLLWLYSYNIKEETLSSKNLFKLEKVISFDYFNDGRQIVFSAFHEGKTNLYLYNTLGNTQKKLTDDFYDDLNPQVSADDQKIFFTSNRNNDSLNKEHEIDRFEHETDIFVYDLLDDENPIQSVTDTDDKNESDPLIVDEKLHYLLRENQLTSRYQATFDSSISRIDTSIHYNYFYRSELKDSYHQNLLEHASANSEQIDQLFFREGKYALLSKKLEKKIGELPNNEKAKQDAGTEMLEEIEKEGFIVFDEVDPPREVDIYNYEFNQENKTSQESEDEKSEKSILSSEKDDIEPLDFPTQRLYRLNFRVDESVLQLNNTFINGQYQLFNGGPFINSGLGINTKIGIVDLMEDHRIYGGFRYSGNLIEYSLSYQNLKKRLDKEFMITRSRERNDNTPFPFDIKTLRGIASFSWPFSEVTSLRGTAAIRNDKVVPLSSNRQNLEFDIFNEYWASLKLAYVFDNTRDISLNIRYGTRFKIFAEQYQMIYSEQDNSQSSDLTVLGFDFRHYQKIHREFIYVGRVAGSKSFGSNPLIYYLGGVDEWWKSDIFDESTPIDFSQNFGFQALAANMRGFLQNIRNGSSFLLINQELRFPVFSYFINHPIQSDFVRDFQIIGFGDIGTAWTGGSPYDDDNPLNNETRVNNPITVTYENINDPLVAGFGFGLRTSLLGYFVRADWAWGVENGEVSDDSMFIFSLSLDI